MTLRDREFVIPEMLVIVGSRADAEALSPLASARDDVLPTLVATGPDPMEVDEVLDDLGTPAGRVLLPGTADACAEPVPALELAALLPRFDELIVDCGPAAVVVRGGSSAALAGAQAAVWRGVPLIALAAPVEAGPAEANRAMIAELAGRQASGADGVAFPTWLDLVVHRYVATAPASASLAGDAAHRVIGLSPGRSSCVVVPGLSA